MKRTLGTELGIGVGTALYDYLTEGAIDWQRSIVITIIAAVLMLVFQRLRK